MNTDDFLTKTEQAVREVISSQGSDEKQYYGKRIALRRLAVEFKSTERLPPFTEEQTQRLRDLAIELHVSGEFGLVVTVVDVLERTGAPGYTGDMECILEFLPREMTEGMERWHYRARQIVSLIEQMRVFEEGERLLYLDDGRVCVKSKEAGRRGFLFLTNKRIIAVGNYSGMLQRKKRHLYYSDWKERPYLSSLDYVYIDKLIEPRIDKGSRIKAKYHTEYWEEKERTFYGPLIFRFDLPSSISMKEGDVDLYIIPTKYREGEHVPRGDHERRTNELFKRIMEIRSKSGPEIT